MATLGGTTLLFSKLKNIFAWAKRPSFAYREGEPKFNKFRAARIWSNRELMQIAHLFTGTICNVSAKRDEDKEGKHYREYFINASRYMTTNLTKDEYSDFSLDLESFSGEGRENNLSFDCVFNHTVLEHIFDCRRAFVNLCAMSRDVVIVVVPYIQQVHASPEQYNDYWRFTPYTMQRMYEENNLKLRYCSANGAERTSIYLFCVGYRDAAKWDKHIPERMDIALDPNKPLNDNTYMNIIGGNVVK